MNNLRKALDKKRELLADDFCQEWPTTIYGQADLRTFYENGFNAATDLMLPLIEELRTALEKSADPLQFVPKDVLWELQRRQLIDKEGLSKLEEFERRLK